MWMLLPKETGDLSKKYDILLMENFNYHNIWKTNSAKHGSSKKKVLTFLADNFLFPKVKKGTRGTTTLEIQSTGTVS